MPRVFMAFLGTNRYVEAHYRLKEELSPPTPFVQEALVSILCQDWTAEDRFVFFLTPAARKKNWEDHGNFPEGLKTRLKKLGLAPQIFEVPFTEGASEAEIMQNFLKVVEHLQEEDEVVFDITHSFRSLPMLNLVALNYARVLKGVQIKGLYYGAFEVLGYPKEVEAKIPVEERIAPVFDLTPYALLLDWSFAVEEFSRYGLAQRLVGLIREKIRPILKETKGQDEKASSLRDFANRLHGLTLNIYTCRCPALEKTDLGQIFSRAFPLDEFLPPFALLFGHIKKKVERFFAEDPWEKALGAVEWCLEHKLIQQGYTILEEAIISEIGRLAGLEDVFDKNNRRFISSLLSMTAQKKPPEEWRGELGARRGEGLAWQQRLGEDFRKLAKAYDSLAQFRNDINHCGCRPKPKNSQVLIESLKAHYDAVYEAMKALRRRQ